MKAMIAVEIIATLNKRGLTARAWAKIAKVDAANIQRIRNAIEHAFCRLKTSGESEPTTIETP